MFGAMMISKQKVAHLALKPLGRNNAIDGTCGVGTKDPQLIFASAFMRKHVAIVGGSSIVGERKWKDR